LPLHLTFIHRKSHGESWVPAFAGMTILEVASHSGDRA